MAEVEGLLHTAGDAIQAVEGSLLDQIISETKIQPSEDGYLLTKKGMEAFLGEALQIHSAEERVSTQLLDFMIGKIDQQLGLQVDAILHHSHFQQLEAAWRSLQLVVEHTDFRENIQLELLNVSKHALLEDFQDAPDIPHSGLYKHIYTAEYGQFGGQPVGAMIANYEFGPDPPDMQLLHYVASVGAMAHAPFIAAASPRFFALDDFRSLPTLRDLRALFEGPQYLRWQAFRASDDARYVGLTLPRFLVRLPYAPQSNPVAAFAYQETVQGAHHHYLWGNTAMLFALRLANSFAHYRWCPNIIGPQSGGAVDRLPRPQFEARGERETKIPTEVLISDRREFELADEGFIPLVMRKGSDDACFFSANSVQKPKDFGITKEAKEAELNYRLGTQLPYTFIISRLVHYIKVIQREQIGSWKERTDLERELNLWIRQYVSDQENPPAAVRSRRPLRQAQITVEDVAGDPGWYRVYILVEPHFKYMGSNFTLSLMSKIEQE